MVGTPHLFLLQDLAQTAPQRSAFPCFLPCLSFPSKSLLSLSPCPLLFSFPLFSPLFLSFSESSLGLLPFFFLG